MENDKIKVGIGFATGRKNFRRILRSYAYNWRESGIVDDKNISINLFVAYDLMYKGTKKSDYTTIHSDVSDLIEDKIFIGRKEVEQAKRELAEAGIASDEETSLLLEKDMPRNETLFYIMRLKTRSIIFSFWMTTNTPWLSQKTQIPFYGADSTF